jgi:hypothetical protein
MIIYQFDSIRYYLIFICDMPTSDTPVTGSPPKLLDQVRDTLRVKNYSIRTEQSYVDWIKRLSFFMASAVIISMKSCCNGR